MLVSCPERRYPKHAAVRFTVRGCFPAAIRRPVLPALGAETQPLWVEIAAFLRSSLPYVEDCTIERVGHLLQIQRPKHVARAIVEFLARNGMDGPLTSDWCRNAIESPLLSTLPRSAGDGCLKRCRLLVCESDGHIARVGVQ